MSNDGEDMGAEHGDASWAWYLSTGARQLPRTVRRRCERVDLAREETHRMSRTKSRKGAITTLPTRKDDHVALERPQGEPTAETATQEVVDEKLLEAAAPKPRRVGPLRKIHMGTLERNAALAEPLLEEIRQLQGKVQQLQREVTKLTAGAFDDILYDLGSARAKDEDARVVEHEGQSYVELSRSATGPAGASQTPRRGR